LNKYISTAAAIVGMFVRLLTIFADFMGSIASESGILLAKI
jgi:hypothetical protein